MRLESELLALVAATGLSELAEAVARWGTDGPLGLWVLPRGVRRRVVDRGLPSGWQPPLPPDGPAARGEAPAPDLAGVVLHRLVSPDGTTVGLLALPEDDPHRTLVRALGAAVSRCLRTDGAAHRAAMLEELLRMVHDGVIAVNVDGALVGYSASLEAMSGWTADDIRAHGWTNLVYTDPVARADAQRGIAALLRGWPSEGMVRTLSRKDGGDVRAAIWSRVVPDPCGGAPAVLGVFRDVTSDEETRRRTAREEGLSQLGRIAGRIAHEYNNLLCAVMGHAELIEGLPDLPGPAQRRASTIVRSARRGAHLSSRLLAFTGTAHPRPEAVDVGEVVSQVEELYGPRLPHGVTMEVRRAEGVPRAEVDPSQLQQALMNLVVNGAESMRHGGLLRVSTRAAPLPTEVTYLSPTAPEAGTEMIEVRVADQGPGFTPRALAHLFEPFFTEKVDGHGMGLPAVRGMLASHGGAALVVNGSPPLGAVFTLWLPRSTRPELKLATLPRDGSLPRRVWLLDDQEAVLEFSRVALEAAGVQVDAFPTVAAITSAPLLDPPDLLILDVQLADGDGPGALRALRERGLAAPVMWITGHSPDALAVPPGPVLRKPYTGADLLQAVAGQ